MANPRGNHEVVDIATLNDAQAGGGQAPDFTYTFQNFFHPFVGDLIATLNKQSLRGMLDPEFLDGLKGKTLPAGDRPPSDTFFHYFESFYSKPDNADVVVEVTGFPKEIDLRVGGPYANYNWELFFHIPLTIAVHLSKSQRFAEAQRWFHFIFDPTCNDPNDSTPQRHWKFLRFRQGGDTSPIDELLALLSKPEEECDDAERGRRADLLAGLNDLKNDPFQPHAVARTRPVAYQYWVVMKYLDNLIAWGDSLSRQDTIESINEATQRYVLAANILGERPQRVPPRGTVRPKSFRQLRQGLDPMRNALVELEGQFPFNLGLPRVPGEDEDAAGPLFGIGRTLYFCIPRNDKLIGYWDTVADRLFKIRHCMSIEGVARQLPLFDPPIDSGMLVKAAAAGIDVALVVSGLNQPVGPLRAPLMIQKALELCAEVRNLGAALLAAIEKEDGERLALLRQGHESKIQQMQQEVRFLQWQQAKEATESLLRGRASALERYDYYLRLLGQTRDENAIPDTFSFTRPAAVDDSPTLASENFDEVYEDLVGQYQRTIPNQTYPQLRAAPAEAADFVANVLDTSNLHLNLYEFMDLNVLAPAAQLLRVGGAVSDAIFAALAEVPDANIDAQYWGIGVHATVAGGSHLADTGRAISSSLNALATVGDVAATYVSKTAAYQRRVDEWILQHNLATRELAQIGRQIIGSLIAEQVAHHEYHVIKKHIEQSQEIEAFLAGDNVGGKKKFTTEQLYGWMQGELSHLYHEHYRFAFDTARRAEQTMKRELMRPELNATDHVTFNYWDGGRKGLLSGEALYLDVKRMEMAYHENNGREYELIKHVSLRQLNPLALLTLKAIGACEIALPEWLFDLDAPGHYMRRIKSVSLSIPAVTGPYTSVNCTLSLLKSTLRRSPLGDQYARDTAAEDDRFVDYFGTVQSIVTSNGQNDSGMFETNLRDERYLPFEGAGAISTWKLELPHGFRQFDYDSIADVILHLRYTARQGGEALRSKAIGRLEELMEDEGTSELVQAFSLRHDFPTEWNRFATGDGEFRIKIGKAHFPYLVQGLLQKPIPGKRIRVHQATFCAVGRRATPPLENAASEADLDAFSSALNEGEEYEFSSAETELLKRDRGAQVVLLLRYHFE